MQYIPFLSGILLIPVVDMLQVIVRIILESNSRSRRPLRMLLRRPLLRQASQLDLLSLAQLTDDSALALRVRNDRITNGIIHALALNSKIPRINGHDSASTARVQRQRHAAAHTVVLAVAVAGVVHLIAVLRVERDHAQTVGEHFVSEDGGVAFDLDQVQGHGGDFGQDRAA